MKNFGISNSQRLRTGIEFTRVYDAKQRAGDANLLVFGAANSKDQTRFGLSVSKKHGNAVRRARLKRLLREAFRLSQHELPSGLDLVLIPKQTTSANLQDFQKSLKRAAAKLSRRLNVEDEQ